MSKQVFVVEKILEMRVLLLTLVFAYVIKKELMKYKKRYNFILCFMLVVITLSATMFFCLPKLNQVESEKTFDEIIADEEDEKNSETSTLKKVKFTNFNTALRHAYNFLNTTTGYKTYNYGKFSLNVKNLVNIEQSIKIETAINNKNKTSHTTVCTYGDGKIKNNTGFEFAKVGDEISMRKSQDRVDGDFDYNNKEVKRYSIDDYRGEWNIMPEDAFTKFSISRVLGGIITKNGNTYKLSFTLERGEIVNDSIVFVKRFFENSKNAQNINPSFYGVSVEMTLDIYGRPKEIQYTAKFYDLSLYGVEFRFQALQEAQPTLNNSMLMGKAFK